MVVAKPGSITPQPIHGAGLHLEERRRRETQAILQWVSATVLHSHDGRDGSVKLPEGVEMVMPGDDEHGM